MSLRHVLLGKNKTGISESKRTLLIPSRLSLSSQQNLGQASSPVSESPVTPLSYSPIEQLHLSNDTFEVYYERPELEENVALSASSLAPIPAGMRDRHASIGGSDSHLSSSESSQSFVPRPESPDHISLDDTLNHEDETVPPYESVQEMFEESVQKNGKLLSKSTNWLSKKFKSGDILKKSELSLSKKSENTLPKKSDISLGDIQSSEEALDPLREQKDSRRNPRKSDTRLFITDDDLPNEAQRAKRWQLGFIFRIDWNYILTILNPVPFFYPLTIRMLIFYALYIALAFIFSGLLDTFPDVWKMASILWSYNIPAILIFFLAIDPCVILLVTIFASYPAQSKPPNSFTESGRRLDKTFQNRATALVITCHHSELSILERTIRSALFHFKPENIHIAHNSNETEAAPDLRDLVASLDKRIHYQYSCIGNKTLSQYFACRFIHEGNIKKARIKYVLLLDDDVVLPASLDLPHEQIDDLTRAVAIGIRGVDSFGGRDLIFTQWQDLEYKLGDSTRLFQNRYGSVLFPHGKCFDDACKINIAGAISLWELGTLFSALTEHDAIFYADDVKMGIWLLKNGYRLGFHAETLVSTETPETILGPRPNYYNQRVRSWDFAGHVKDRPGATITVKVFQMYALYTSITDWLRVPILAYSVMASPETFNTTFWIMIGLNIGAILVWNYMGARKRPDVRVSFLAIMTFPFYKAFSSLLRIVSMVRCYLVYWPRFEENLARAGALTEQDVADIVVEKR
ncbi:MAG: hypothetical protein SGCHY_005517 [Lobulomycetales sp.]